MRKHSERERGEKGGGKEGSKKKILGVIENKQYNFRLILGWISRRWDVGIWTGLGWPRIETGGGCL